MNTPATNNKQSDESKKTVLILEDQPDLRVLYGQILSSAGFSVEMAPDGGIGLDMIRQTAWDLLLLDIMLPIMDGTAILKIIKSENIKKGPVLLLTNISNENLIVEALSNGADGYIVKTSVTPDQVVLEVKNAFKHQS